MDLRLRFAPSPTGYLHIGSARTALYNWLLARANQGAFVLRIEDTDNSRSTEEAIGAIIEDLRWLGGLGRGPDVGGPHGPYRQTERMGLYGGRAGAAQRGAAYRCYCEPAGTGIPGACGCRDLAGEEGGPPLRRAAS